MLPDIFTAHDLIFDDYRSSGSYECSDPKISGEPDDTMFARHEVAQMLYFINYCYTIWGWPTYAKAPGKKLERLIRTFVPKEFGTQKQVLDWIEQHWFHFWDHALIRR